MNRTLSDSERETGQVDLGLSDHRRTPASGKTAAGSRCGAILFRASLGSFAAVFLCDAAGALTGRGALEAGARTGGVLVAVAGYAALVALPVGGTAAALGLLGRWLARRFERSQLLRGLVSSLPLSVPLGIASAFALRHLLAGRGAKISPFWTLLHDEALLIAPVAVALAGCLAAVVVRSAWQGGMRRIAFLILGFGAVLATLLFDLDVHPDRYPAAHALSRLAAALLGGGLGAVYGADRPLGRLARVGAIAALTTVGIFAVIGPTPSDVRAAAFRDTVFLRLALRYLTPVPDLRTSVDPTALARVAAQKAIDPADLDRAFPLRRKFNILWFTIDAWRSDSVIHRYGDRPVMPHAAAFARTALRFDAAWTPFPSTGQAFAAIFCGREATATDVGRTFAESRRIHGPHRSDPVLPELLAQGGYRTEATVGFDERLVGFGFPFLRQGFAHWNEDPRLKIPPLDARHIAAAALHALDRDSGRPFFLWAHVFDPHDPYTPAVEAYGTTDRNRYDAELSQADQALGLVLDGLAARGLAETTCVVVCGDHGEEFRDRGTQFHATAVSDAQLHVPLLVRVPGARPGRVAAPVSLIDLFPTMLELVGRPVPPSHGRSLLPAIARGGDVEGGADRTVFAALVGPDPQHDLRRYAIRSGALEFHRDEDAGVEGLFDLDADPEEMHDLSGERPDELLRMRRALDLMRVRAALPPGPSAPR